MYMQKERETENNIGRYTIEILTDWTIYTVLYISVYI